MEKPKRIEFKIDEKIGSGEYINIANVIFNDSEFIIDFARIAPGVPVAQVKSRIILNPKNAKILSKVISKRIDDYEKTVGKIKLANEKDGTNIGFKLQDDS